MNIAIFIVLLVAKFSAANEQEDYWVKISEKFEQFASNLSSILDRVPVTNVTDSNSTSSRPPISTTTKTTPTTSTKSPEATKTTSKIGGTTKINEDNWIDEEMNLPDCRQTVEDIIHKIRSDIKLKRFNRDEYHFEQDIPAMEAHCQNLSLELKPFFKKEKNPLLQEIYDLLTSLDESKADWEKIINKANEVMTTFVTYWNESMPMNDSYTAALNHVLGRCMKYWNDIKIMKNIYDQILTSSVFRAYFGKFQAKCYRDLIDMSRNTENKLGKTVRILGKIFEKLLSTSIVQISHALPADEYTPFNLVAEKANWTAIKETISKFVNKRNEIFKLAENQTNNMDLEEAYKTCKKFLNIEDSGPDSLYARIRVHSLSKLYFVGSWWDIELKSTNTCKKYFGKGEGPEQEFAREYDFINTTLTGLHEEFKKGDYNYIFDQLPEKSFEDEKDVY